MPAPVSARPVLWVLSLAFFWTSTATAQLPAGWEQYLDDQTVLVVGAGSWEEFDKWLSWSPLGGRLPQENPGEGACGLILSATAGHLLLEDPDQKRRQRLASGASRGSDSTLTHAAGLTVASFRIPGFPAGQAPCSPAVREAWVELTGAASGSSFSLSCLLTGDTGRVVSELAPAVLEPIPGVDAGRLLAGIRSLQFRSRGNGEPVLELVVRTDGDATAAGLAECVQPVREYLEKAMVGRPDAAVKMGLLVLGGESRIRKDEFSLTVVADPAVPSLKQALDGLRTEKQALEATQSVKQLILAMHNYQSAFREFPAAAVGQGDSPGLSWRVAILPYLEELELYRKFRMDEPWDSEHNRALIGEMPRIFLNPCSGLKVSDGRSSYVIPTGEGLFHHGSGAATFKTMRDGSSNTTIIFAVDDGQAAVWTRPDTKNFDPGNPREGLWKSPSGCYLFGLADGSVQQISDSESEDTIRALMTIDGGEVIQLKDRR